MFSIRTFLFMLFIGAAYQSDSIGATSSITFPATDDFPHKCTLSDGTQGTCRNLKNCPMATTSQELETCYFIQFEQFVCCRDKIWYNMANRPILAGCFNRKIVHHITHGRFTEYKEFPYMVSLGWENIFKSNSYDYKCGGVLISGQYVLTAAHCIKLHGTGPSVALIGGVNLTETSVKPLQIDKLIVHPDYKSNESYHDIALIKLAEDSTETKICLWPFFHLDNINVTAIGYGNTKFGGPRSTSLLQVQLTVIANDACNARYTNESTLPHGITHSQICAYDPDKLRDTCQGDSGGPLILRSNGLGGGIRPYIVGITSFGRGCALDSTGVYTRVSEYIDWIENVVFSS